jgi:hypothetical protein
LPEKMLALSDQVDGLGFGGELKHLHAVDGLDGLDEGGGAGRLVEVEECDGDR